MFNLQLVEGRAFQTHSESIDYLASQGFQTIPRGVFANAEQINAEIVRLGDSRDELPFDMDGAVVKVNSLSDRAVVGSTAKGGGGAGASGGNNCDKCHPTQPGFH